MGLGTLHGNGKEVLWCIGEGLEPNSSIPSPLIPLECLLPHSPHSMDVLDGVADLAPQILLIELHLNKEEEPHGRG